MESNNGSNGSSIKKSKRKSNQNGQAHLEEKDSTNILKPIHEKKKKRKHERSTPEEINQVLSEETEHVPKKKKIVNSSKQEPDIKAIVNETLPALLAVFVTGTNSESFKPITTFVDAPFSKEMLVCCESFAKPTPIQGQCWPVILKGRDIIAIAETGSGKTIAFALPALVHIKKHEVNLKQGPVVLVLSPTRELAMQTAEVCKTSGQNCSIRSVCLYGGVEKDSQRQLLKKGPHIIIATPGRLLDLVNEGVCNLANVSYLVLDEADRMLDLGFEKDVRTIIQCINTNRQTLMFSATWPVTIQALGNEFLSDPIKIVIGSEDLAANHKVTQHVEVMDPDHKFQRLQQLLQLHHKSRNNRILVFALYKKEASRLESMLRAKGWNVQSIHGDKSQTERTKAMSNFKDGTIPLLVATDVAARGLDIPDVEYVVNYTFPLTIEDYVHRIGRTGRAGKVGTSYTFFTLHDKSHGGELVNVLNEASQNVPEDLLKFGSHVKKKEHALYGAHFKEIDTSKKSSHIKF